MQKRGAEPRMKEPARPVKLHFFVKATKDKFLDLCTELEYAAESELLEDGSFNVRTQPLTSTERRNFISKWSEKTMEIIK